jgi:hypothetical protein
MVIPDLDRIVRVDPIKTGVLRLRAPACGGAALGTLASGGCDERGFSLLVAHYDDASGWGSSLAQRGTRRLAAKGEAQAV